MFFFVESVVAGLTYGFIVGCLKYAILWRKNLKSNEKMERGALYLRMGIGYAVNVAALLFVFLMRNIMPLDFASTVVAAAVAMSLAGKLAPMNRILDCVKETEK